MPLPSCLPRLALLLCACLAGPARALEPFATRFAAPAELSPSHASFAQDRQHTVYVGSDGAVLRFDGARWQRIELAAPGAVRSLLVDRNDRVWVGAYDRPGWLQTGADGQTRFVPLQCGPPCEPGEQRFADVWSLVERDEGIYLQGLYDLVLVDHQGRLLRHWHNDRRFGEMASVHGELYLQFRGEGLRRLQQGEFVDIPGGDQFKGTRIYNLLPVGDGQVLVHDLSPRLALLDAAGVQAWPHPVAADDLKSMLRGAALDPRHLGFTGDDGVLRVLDLDSGRLQRYRLGEHYQRQLVRDRQGGWVIAEEIGLVRFEWPLAASVYTSADGLRGDLHRVATAASQLHLLGSAGVYSATVDDRLQPALPFSAQPWTGSEGWDLLRDGEGWLLAESYALLSIDASGQRQRIESTDRYPRRLLRSRIRPDRLWVGGEHGAAVYRRSGPGWALHSELWLKSELIDSLVELDADRVLVGSARLGARILQLGADERLQWQPLQQPGADRVADDGPARVSRFADDDVLISLPGRLLQYRDGAFQPTALDALADQLRADELVELRPGTGGQRWAFSERRVFHFAAERGWRELDALSSRLGQIGDLHPLADGGALVAGSGRLLRLQAPADADGPRDVPRLRLASMATTTRDSSWTPLALDRAPVLQGGSGGLRFEIAWPDLRKERPASFRMRIRELDPAWSPWGETPYYVVSGLAPGDYLFEVEARRGHEPPVQRLAQPFSVAPRWYERDAVRVFAALLLVALGGLAVQQRNRLRLGRMRALNRDLDRLVKARTLELEQANRQLSDLAERDGLTQVGNRRLFDRSIDSWMQRARGNRRELALLLCDVDHFKQYNDSHGHVAGDDLLRRLGAILQAQAREDTLVARYGGEEFAILTLDCGLRGAQSLAERLRQAVEGSLGGATVSLGFALFDPQRDRRPEHLIARADAALYAAKRAGRNRVVGAGDESA